MGEFLSHNLLAISALAGLIALAIILPLKKGWTQQKKTVVSVSCFMIAVVLWIVAR